MAVQGHRIVRRPVGHSAVAGAAPSVGRQLRAHGDHRDAAAIRLLDHERPAARAIVPTAYVEPANANREDNIWVFDVRAEKTVNLDRPAAHRVLFLDLFNITNSHASETISRATGLSYLKPSAILAPFTRARRVPVSLVRSRRTSWTPVGESVGGSGLRRPLPSFLLGEWVSA